MKSWILYFYYAVASLVAFFSALTAFIEQPTDGDTVGVGGYAALIALSVTSIAVLERLRSSASLRQKGVAAGVGTGLIVSAYLWMADEAGYHPLNREFLAGLGLVWGLVAGIAFICFLVALAMRSESG